MFNGYQGSSDDPYFILRFESICWLFLKYWWKLTVSNIETFRISRVKLCNKGCEVNALTVVSLFHIVLYFYLLFHLWCTFLRPSNDSIKCSIIILKSFKTCFFCFLHQSEWINIKHALITKLIIRIKTNIIKYFILRGNLINNC